MEIPPKCEFCNKAVGQQIFSCPHRPDGGCPFLFEVEKAGSGTKPGCMLFVLLFICIWITIPTVGFTNIIFNAQAVSAVVASLGALACFWGVGLLFFGFIFYVIFGKNIVLYNPESGAMGKYVTIFGQTVGSGTSAGWQPLPSEVSQLSLLEPLHYPASVSALSYASQAAHYREFATYICEATLLAMVAQNVLELKYTKTSDTLLWVVNRQTERYFLTPKNDASVSAVDGVLERKIVEVFSDPSSKLQGEPHLEGAPIEINILIAAIYDKDHYQPQKWLIKLVEEDLISRGLGHRVKSEGITGWFKKSIELDFAHENAIENEFLLMRQEYEQLELTCPGFTKKLRGEIGKAFSNRTESSD